MSRLLRFFVLVGLLTCAPVAEAAPSAFDLVGPRLDVAVTHNGSTLPLEWVPNLAEGDRVSIKLDLSPGQNERYRIVAAFLRGAVDRPPKDWFHDALTGARSDSDLSLEVPRGAQQLALFILPERGGGADAIVNIVRKQPGAFVRAVQELNQVSLDRARLDTFLASLLKAERHSPAGVSAASKTLTRSLAVKLKEECLQQPPDLQAACLTGDRETLLLADTHSSALADTLAGTPTDLAFQLSATPQAGYGSYSSYIGVVRDIFRLFGAFQSTRLQFIPAVAHMGEDRVTLLLNTPLSFAKPTSVMVVALPAIEAAKPPPLRISHPDITLCLRPGAVLPVEGAPLVYATRYAHNMAVRMKRADGTLVDVPAHADASRGGFVIDDALRTDAFGAVTEGRLHGDWGFTKFDAPTFTFSNPKLNGWTVPPHSSLVVGRVNALELTGGGAGCVGKVEMRFRDGPAQEVNWKQTGPGGIELSLPLEKATAGLVSLTITGLATGTSTTVTLPALQEIGRLESLGLHEGDDQAILAGSRLDQVTEVTLGTATFRPGPLTRADKQDRLTLIALDPATVRPLAAGTRIMADIRFAGDRHKTLAVTIGPRRAPVALLRVTAQSPRRAGTVPIEVLTDGVFPQDARLTFAFRPDRAMPLTGTEVIEVATMDGRATARIKADKGYDLQDVTTGIVTFVPRDALGPLAYGPLHFRVLKDDVASGWEPLTTIVRLPEVHAVTCPSAVACRITADRLFLINAIGATDQFDNPEVIPDGFTAESIGIASRPGKRIFLRLRDAPGAVATVSPP